MAEYIERESLLKQLEGACSANCGHEHGEDPLCPSCFMNDAINVVEDQTAEDVKPVKRGVWEHITLGYDNIPFVKCNQCGLVEPWDEYEGMGFALHNQMYANFCPNCGADMREG